MDHFNEEYQQMNGHRNPRPTGKSMTSTSSMIPGRRLSSYAMTNPDGYHENVPPSSHPNNAETPYSQWVTRGRETEHASRERNDNIVSAPDFSRWRHPHEEVSSRYSTSLEDYYHTPSYHYSTPFHSSSYSYHHAARTNPPPLPPNGYSAETVGDIFRSPLRDSYSTPPDRHSLPAASPSPQMVTPTRAICPEDASRKSLAPMLPHYESSTHVRPNHDFHDEGRIEEPRKILIKGRPTLPPSLIWHLEENDIVCGRGVSFKMLPFTA
jgi:hypothetical protein